MKNPISALIATAGMSIRQFEQRYDISHSAIMMQVVGTHEAPLPRVESSIREAFIEKGLDFDSTLESEYGTSDLTAAYLGWRDAEREEFARTVQWPRVGRGRDATPKSPVQKWIESLSGGPTRFAKQLKVPHSAASQWYNGKGKGIPHTIAVAFEDAGFAQAEELQKQQGIWEAKRNAR